MNFYAESPTHENLRILCRIAWRRTRAAERQARRDRTAYRIALVLALSAWAGTIWLACHYMGKAGI